MKTIIKTIAIALLASTLAFTTEAKASEPITPKSFNVGMYNVSNTLKMKVLVEKTAGSSLNVKLKNSSGETLFEEVVGKKETAFAKNFNMEGLEDGKYYFEITNGKERIEKEVNISSKQINPTDYRAIEVK